MEPGTGLAVGIGKNPWALNPKTHYKLLVWGGSGRTVYQWYFQAYGRRFRQPLHTHHGVWHRREGVVITLRDLASGRTVQGEVAPIPWFGSETLAEAIAFLEQLPSTLAPSQIYEIPDRLPATQFAFGCGLAQLAGGATMGEPLGNALAPERLCYLLPGGDRGLSRLQGAWIQGFRTFKVKIAVETVATEQQRVTQLLAQLPPGGKLRLDANGGLTGHQARQWLDFAADHGAIEYVEQPLAPEHLDTMIQLQHHYPTAIALDESVSTGAQLRQTVAEGWPGIYVLKVGILGFPQVLVPYLQGKKLDGVISSVLETAVGRRGAIATAQQLNHPRALGLGVGDWFREDR